MKKIPPCQGASRQAEQEDTEGFLGELGRMQSYLVLPQNDVCRSTRCLV